MVPEGDRKTWTVDAAEETFEELFEPTPVPDVIPYLHVTCV